jgi:hypothetical protein
MEESSIQMIVSMMWQMTVSRLSQTLRMVMGSTTEGEMVLVGVLWALAVLISSRFVFGFLHFLFFYLGYMNSFCRAGPGGDHLLWFLIVFGFHVISTSNSVINPLLYSLPK